MISVSRSTVFDPSKHTHFIAYSEAGLNDLAAVTMQKPWCPSIFREGYRKNMNFLATDYLALDFDSGAFTLKAALEFLKTERFAHVVYTTKSHGLDKITEAGVVQKACDRFRVILPLSRRVTDRNSFYFMHSQAKGLWRGATDKACIDPARFFYPGKDLASVSWGRRLDPGRPPAGWGMGSKKERVLAQNSCVPENVVDYLRGARPGERNRRVFSASLRMISMGIPREQIVMVAARFVDLSETEIRRTVGQAASYVG